MAQFMGFKNRIINGAMMIDQRNAGASVTSSAGLSVYAVDRWVSECTVSSKFTSQQNAGAVTPPVGYTKYLGITSSAATSLAASDFHLVSQLIEGYNVADLGWGTANAQAVRLSFWARSSLTGTFGGVASNSAQNRSYPFTFTINAANTWEQKTVTIDGDQSGTWVTDNGCGLRIRFSMGSGSNYSGTAGAWAGATYFSATGATSVVGTSGATFYITGVQLEKGSTATSFDYRPYGTELALCQRYCQLAGSGASGSFDGPAVTTFIQIVEKCAVQMRAAPTASIIAGVPATFRCSGADLTSSSPTLTNFTAQSAGTSFWTQVTGFTGGTGNSPVTSRNNQGAYGGNFILLSAEL